QLRGADSGPDEPRARHRRARRGRAFVPGARRAAPDARVGCDAFAKSRAPARRAVGSYGAWTRHSSLGIGLQSRGRRAPRRARSARLRRSLRALGRVRIASVTAVGMFTVHAWRDRGRRILPALFVLLATAAQAAPSKPPKMSGPNPFSLIKDSDSPHLGGD